MVAVAPDGRNSSSAEFRLRTPARPRCHKSCLVASSRESPDSSLCGIGKNLCKAALVVRILAFVHLEVRVDTKPGTAGIRIDPGTVSEGFRLEHLCLGITQTITVALVQFVSQFNTANHAVRKEIQLFYLSATALAGLDKIHET